MFITKINISDVFITFCKSTKILKLHITIYTFSFQGHIPTLSQSAVYLTAILGDKKTVKVFRTEADCYNQFSIMLLTGMFIDILGTDANV